MITERDILTKTALDGGTRYAMLDPAIRDFMTPAEQVSFAAPDWTLAHCLSTMLERGFRHLPIGADPRNVEAILSMRDIAHAAVADGVPKSTMTVGMVASNAMSRRLTGGGMELQSTVATVPRESTVADAVKCMRDRRVGSVLVPTSESTLEDSRDAFGIFTERDYLKLLSNAASDGSDPRQTPVAAVMTTSDKLMWVEPGMPAMEALRLMATHNLRHLPVRKPPTWLWRPGMGDLEKATVANEPPALLGVVSMRELCKQLLVE